MSFIWFPFLNMFLDIPFFSFFFVTTIFVQRCHETRYRSRICKKSFFWVKAIANKCRRNCAGMEANYYTPSSEPLKRISSYVAQTLICWSLALILLFFQNFLLLFFLESPHCQQTQKKKNKFNEKQKRWEKCNTCFQWIYVEKMRCAQMPKSSSHRQMRRQKVKQRNPYSNRITDYRNGKQCSKCVRSSYHCDPSIQPCSTSLPPFGAIINLFWFFVAALYVIAVCFFMFFLSFRSLSISLLLFSCLFLIPNIIEKLTHSHILLIFFFLHQPSQR